MKILNVREQIRFATDVIKRLTEKVQNAQSSERKQRLLDLEEAREEYRKLIQLSQLKMVA